MRSFDPVCPYCGRERKNFDYSSLDWGYASEVEEELDCSGCGETYMLTVQVDFLFSCVASKIEEKGGE